MIKSTNCLLILLCCFSFWELNSQISTDGLIAYYPFNGNVIDESPSGFDGSLVGGQFVTDEDGNSNSALELDGINDYLNLSSFAIPFKENLSEITIFFKVKFIEFGDDQTILSLGNSGENLQTNVFEIEYEHNRLQVETESLPNGNAINNEYEIDQTENLFTNEWIDIMIYLKDDSLTYCRNNEVIYKEQYIPTITLSETLFIGCFGGNNVNSCCFFGGQIDELQFYDRLLPKNNCPDIPVSSAQSFTICPNTSIVVNDIEYNSAGSFEQTLTTNLGCDSVLTVTVEISEIIETIETYSGCNGDEYSIEVGDQIFDESNPFGVVLLESAVGCDSLVEVDLVFEDCTNCVNATPGLNLQILKSASNTYSIYYSNQELNLIKPDIGRTTTCDYVMYIKDFYNSFRTKNEAYYMSEEDLLNLLKDMNEECVIKL